MGLHKQNMASVMSMPPGLRASRAAPALPSSLAGLVAWGEGSDLGADGTAISSWLNKTLSGLDPAQGTAGNQPTVKANAINGQKAALFTRASSQALLFPAGSLGWFQNVAGGTFLLVLQPVSVVTANVLGASINAGNTPRLDVTTLNTGVVETVARSDDSSLSSAGSSVGFLGTSSAYLVVGIINAAGGTQSIIVNGATIATAAVSPAQNTPNTASGSVSIGARGGDLANAFDGYIAAYAMYTVVYSRVQLAGVLNRWATLYGITLTG